MNEIDYITEVNKERSFSVAAQNLYITQPALSAAVKKVEENIGIKIFDRSTVPVSLTPEGQIYIRSLEEIRSIEQQTARRLNDMSNLKTGYLNVAGENFICTLLMPRILLPYIRRYPGIRLELTESGTQTLQKCLQNGEVDVLFGYSFDATTSEFSPLITESILLCVPKMLPINQKLKGYRYSSAEIQQDLFKKDGEERCVDPALFAEEEFVMLRKDKDMYRRGMAICEAAGFRPKVTLRLEQLISSYHMASGGVGIAFITDTLVKSMPLPESCFYYKLKGEAAKRTLGIAVKKNRYMSKAAQAFLDVAKEAFPSYK